MKAALALIALSALAACGGPADEAASNMTATNNMGAPQRDGAKNLAAPVANVTVPTDDAAPLDRFGPIRVGATVAELTGDGLKVASRDKPVPGSSCSYVRFQNWPDVAVMLDGERVVRMDISGKQYDGPQGLRIGQSEADALAKLGTAKVELHPYTGPQGHYLVLHEVDAPYGLIAETDGRTVLRWRLGQWKQVQWVESCF